MYGSSEKMGRGGGGGGGSGKRNVQSLPICRPTPAGRMSMGGDPRGRGGTSSAVASSPSASSLQVEESFSLVRENPLNFGMAIKLAPDLVDEIKRVEAQGGAARIKFGANACGNVIHVGDKTFKFTWSREPGYSCDIYKERQSGDCGNGMLIESGGTWRKLNVERELDESTKNHVKKQKSEPTSGVPPKSMQKPSLPTTTVSKGRFPAGSPLPSQPEQLGPSTSPVGSGDFVKGYTAISDFSATHNLNKIPSYEKDATNIRNSNIREESKQNWNIDTKPADLRSLMISQLLEHQSSGMSFKALDKVIGDAMPHSTWKIEPILKQIANYQAPGRYFLKPGIDLEGFNKLPQSGSSPEINHDQSPAPQKFDQLPAQDHSSPMRTVGDNEELGELNFTPARTTDTIEKIDTVPKSPENLCDKNVSNDCEGMAGSSSDSGSDSDSSDSGSDSGSHSKSRSGSPVGSQGGSSSDSDTDASSSGKQPSDEDVDIMMSDDEKESKFKLQDPDPTASRNPVLCSNLDNEYVDNKNSENQDHHVSDVIEIDIEKDSPEGDHVAEMPAPNRLLAKDSRKPIEEIKPSSANHYDQQDRRVSGRREYDDGSGSAVDDGFKHGQSGIQGRSPKVNSKRRFDDEHLGERTQNKQRSKSKNSIEPVTIKSLFGESPHNSSPDRSPQGLEKHPADLMEDRSTCNDSSYPDLQTSPNQVIYRPVSDSQQPAKISSEARVGTEAPSGEKRSSRHNSLDLCAKYSERNLQISEGLQIQKGFTTEAQSEDDLVNERQQLKSTGVGDKHAPILDSHTKKLEMPRKVKEIVPCSNSYGGCSPNDNNPNIADRSTEMNSRSGILRREHSDLELGEFREPFHEDTPVSKKKFERKSSFKHLENKQMDAEYWNSDLCGGKTSNKIPADLGKLSSPNSENAISSIPDEPYKWKAQDNYANDHRKPHNRGARPLNLHHQPQGGSSQPNTIPEMSGKTRFSEAETGQSASMEVNGETSWKMPADSIEQKHLSFQGVGVDNRAMKHSKKQKPKMTGVSNDRQRIGASTGSNDHGQKKKLSSSDETSSSFAKFAKEVPELKGPIRDSSQYKEYVKEYQEKYDSYCSLNKVLESYRDEFRKIGKDLEVYKGKDVKRYNDILEQMRSSFRQCGEKHKRLKKIFLVLHEELKHSKHMIKEYAASFKKN